MQTTINFLWTKWKSHSHTRSKYGQAVSHDDIIDLGHNTQTWAVDLS